MKPHIVIRIIPALLLATTAFAEAENRKEILIRRAGPAETKRYNVKIDEQEPREKEKVAYLGVETMPVDPTVAVQLGLTRGTGLVVRRVAEGSPAAGVLQQHDILTKLDDQILVNMPQFTVLVRNHKAGDEVKLTYIRGGKEFSVKARLGEREVPKLAWEPGIGMPALPFLDDNGPGGDILYRRAGPGLPALDDDEAGNVMRIIGGDRMHWFARPRVHIVKRAGGKSSTILDLPSGSFVFSDDEGSVELNAADGKRELTIKDKQGKVTFQGPLTTPEDHDRLPPEVKERLDVIGGAELDEDGDGIEVQTKVLPPPAKTRLPLPPPDAEAAQRSL
jgi:hypothetical protein